LPSTLSYNSLVLRVMVVFAAVEFLYVLIF